MILPTKHITIENSILGLGALILTYLDRPRTVSALWEKVRERPEISTFERFSLGLDLLFIMNIIEFRDDKIRRSSK